MSFYGSKNPHLFPAQMFRHPWGEHPADAMMVTDRTAMLENFTHYITPEAIEFVFVPGLHNKNEIQIRSLGIEVGGMGHTQGLRSLLYERTDTLVKPVQVLPSDTGFKGIKDDAVVKKVIPHVDV